MIGKEVGNGALEGKEEYRSRGVEMEWGHPDGSTWVSKLFLLSDGSSSKRYRGPSSCWVRAAVGSRSSSFCPMGVRRKDTEDQFLLGKVSKSDTEGDLFLSEWRVLQKDTEEDHRSFGQVKAPPQKGRTVMRAESVEAQDYVSAPLLTSHLEQKMEAEEEVEELSFVPSAASEPRWVLHMCAKKCSEQGLKFFRIAAIVTGEGGAAHTINLCKTCYNVRRQKQGEEEVAASKWRALVGPREVSGSLWCVTNLAQDVGTFHHKKKRGAERS